MVGDSVLESATTDSGNQPDSTNSTEEMGPVVRTVDLTKRFEEITALSHVSLEINKGDVFGLIGPNGAGKTTMIKILTGLLDPTSGSATVLGHDVVSEPTKVKQVTGYLPENPGYYEDLTSRQNIEYFAELYGLPRDKRKEKADTLLELLGLGEWGDVKVGKFSKGMRQRLGIAVSVVNDPAVVFLDEPTHGLDPYGMAQIRELIERMNKEMGVTIILSTHLLFEVAEICRSVGILASGRLIAVGETNSLSNSLKGLTGTRYSIELKPGTAGMRSLITSIRDIPGVEEVEARDNRITVRAQAESDPREAIFHAVVRAGAAILSLNQDVPSLEEVFLKVYQESELGGRLATEKQTAGRDDGNE